MGKRGRIKRRIKIERTEGDCKRSKTRESRKVLKKGFWASFK
jgi:hypothetical protein